MVLWAILAVTCLSVINAEELPPSCQKRVYCNSDLLHRVQMSKLYEDSKTFVDFHLLSDEDVVLDKFNEMVRVANGNVSIEQLRQFINENFSEDEELEMWTPNDYSTNPEFLNKIKDVKLKQYAKNVHDIWPKLGRKVKQDVVDNPDRYSLIPVPNGFIIPGGRFREIYYWDAYWIVEGLLISGMKDTARGMIENLIDLLKKLGHVPNGSRWYYEERSQPPLLTAMVSLYMRETGDMAFLKAIIDDLEEELEYWLETQTVSFDKNGKTYTMLRYNVPSAGPRPESYYVDYTNAQYFETEARQNEFYANLKSAAESGWDFSSRWFIDDKGGNSGNLTNVQTTNIIPVDLNAIFANALQTVAYFRSNINNPRRSTHWAYLARQWRDAINEVFWNKEDGIWYDYDLTNKKHRQFFYPSNLAPLWMGAVHKSLVKVYAPKVLNYMRKSKALDFPGGIPSSLSETGEQWDMPNAWPPLVSIVVNALEALGTTDAKKMAFSAAQVWVRSCMKGYELNKQMFEKYDAISPGQVGGGGEYTVQEGFGWSNGVVLEFLAKYGWMMTADDALMLKKLPL